jgi:hypothetical protein
VSRLDSEQSTAASLAVLAAFVGLGLVGVLHHEPWRDEIEIWLIARDSASLGALLRNMGTEGHPVLWYFVNFALTLVTHDPLAMQLTNLAIGAAAALVFFRTAPFGLVTRLLFVFGYYALFEFTVIARSYALELLLLFSYCAHAARRGGRIDLPGAALLALLANTNLFGTIAVVALVAAETLDVIAAPAEGRGARLRARLPALGLAARLPALGLAAGGAALGFAHVLAQSLAIGPDHGGGYRATYDLGWLLAGFAAPAFGALPLPDLASEHAWNSNLMRSLPAPWHPIVPALASLVLVAAAAAALRHRPRWCATFLLGIAPLVGLTLFVWYGSQRHHGQPFLWFIACAWLAGGLRRPAEPVVVGLLALQLLAGGALLAQDLARPFSSARAAGRWLEQPENADAVLVGSRDFAVEPIAAWTRRPFYYPDQRRFGTFMHWGPARVEVGQGRIESDCVDLVRREGRRVLLVLNSPPGALALGAERELRPGIRVRYVARFTGAIVADENYHVLAIEPVRH